MHSFLEFTVLCVCFTSLWYCANGQIGVLCSTVCNCTPVPVNLQDADCSKVVPPLLQQPVISVDNIRRLDLSSNNLKDLNVPALVRLTEMIDLDLSSNSLTSLDIAALASMPRLESINASQNLLQTIENISSIPTQTSLLTLNASKILLGTIENISALPTQTSLKSIDLSDNPLQCSCNLLAVRDWAKRLNVKLINATCDGDSSNDVEKMPSQHFGSGTCGLDSVPTIPSSDLLPPGPVTVSLVSSTGATVRWDPPIGGAPFTGFLISTIPDYGVRIIPSEVTNREELTCQLTDLTPGQSYTIVIETKNDVIRSGAATKTFTTIPLPPRTVTVYNIATSQATISWQPPGGRSQYSGFKISFTPPTDQVVISPSNLGPNDKSAVLTNLIPDVQYTVNVMTVSGKVNSSPMTQTFTTKPELSSLKQQKCAVCSNVTEDTACGGQDCPSGKTACQTQVLMLDQRWKISKSCITMATCRQPEPITGVGFTLCCSGDKQGYQYCNEFTNFTDWVEEIPLVVKMTLKPNIDSNNKALESTLLAILSASNAIYTVTDKQFNADSRELSVSVNGSFLKNHADFFVTTLTTILGENAGPGGQLSNYVQNGQLTVTRRDAVSIKCLIDVVTAGGKQYLWPETEVEATVELPCPDNSNLKIIRKCETGALWGTPNYAACGGGPAACGPDNLTVDGEVYKWPTTPVGSTATVPCPVPNTQQSATRMCGTGALWGTPNFAACGGGVVTCDPETTQMENDVYKWPTTPVGSTATVPCPVPNIQQSATRLCVTGSEGRATWLRADYDLCYAKPTAVCRAQNMTVDRWQFVWPETSAGSVAELACPLSTKGRKALRRCIAAEVNPLWAEPDLSACPKGDDVTTETLQALTNMTVSVDNVVFVTSTMAIASKNVTHMTSHDMSMIGELLNNVVQSGSVYNITVQSESSKEIAATLNNLIGADPADLIAAEKVNGTVNSIVRSIESFALGLTLQSDAPVHLAQSDLTITTMKRPQQMAGGHLVMVSDGSDSATIYNNDVPGSQSKKNSGVSLPMEVFDASTEKVSFIVYNKNTLFKSMTSSWAGEEAVLPVGKIISASVGIKRENLSKPVVITIVHTERQANQTPRCVYWDFDAANGRGNWSDHGCTVARTTNTSTECECNHMTNFALLMDVYGSGDTLSEEHQKILAIVSLVGCSLSLAGLLLTIIIYFLFRRKLLKNMPSKILMNLCFALICVNIIFLSGTQYDDDDIICKVVGIILHYFLLSSFCWMLVEAFYMYLSLVRVFQTYFTKLIWKFSAFAWGLPLVIIIITIAVSRNNYALQYSKVCWLSPMAFYFAFLAPLAAILLGNMVAFLMVLHQLRTVTSRKKLTRADATGRASQFRAALSILVLLGLTWCFAFLAIGGAKVVFNYLFAICNTLQGLFIFIFYCIWKRDVQAACMRSLPCCPQVSESTSKTGSSDEWFRLRRSRPSLSTTVSSGSLSGPHTYVPRKRSSYGTRGLPLERSSSLKDRDSSSAYRKSKGSLATTFTSFQKEGSSSRKLSDTDFERRGSHVNKVYYDGSGNDVNEIDVNVDTATNNDSTEWCKDDHTTEATSQMDDFRSPVEVETSQNVC